MDKQTNKIYRIWFKNEWYYDFNAIRNYLSINEKLADHPTQHFIIKPKNMSFESTEIKGISAKHILKILRLIYDENIYEIFKRVKNGGHIKFNLYEKYEDEEYIGLLGRTKEDFLDHIGNIFSQLFIAETFPVGRHFNVYDKKKEKLILQPQLKALPKNFNESKL